MTSLVKNELIKILHKKGLYIYLIIIILFMSFALVTDKLFDNNSEDFYELREEMLKDYNLEDKNEAAMYVQEKTDIDVHKIALKYDYLSPEYYYIDTELYSTVASMYTAKYVSQDDEVYNMYLNTYNEQLKILDNFNWRAVVEEKKKELQTELDEYKNMEDDTDVKLRVQEIGYELEGIEYRLRNDVAPSYKSSSSLVESYVRNAKSYNEINDEAYASHEELLSRREIEKDYFVSKYKIDNNIVDSDDSFQKAFVGDLEEASSFFVIAMLIIAGGIFAEEFNKGTIKQLLVKPFTRVQIYVSKIIAIFITLLLFIVAYCCIISVYYALSVGHIVTIFDPIIDYSFVSKSVVEFNTITYVLRNFVAYLPQLLILTFVCTFVGILTTSTVGAIISVFGLIFVNGILSAFVPEKILVFLPMNCWDFSSYLSYGMSVSEYGSFASSLTICVVTILLLFGLGLLLFKNKDIKNQ